MKEADWVLICVCEKYRSRFDGELDDGRGHGVVFEGCIVTNTLYRGEMKNVKYIPILFNRNDTSFVPDELNGASCYLIPDQQQTLITKIQDFANGKHESSSSTPNHPATPLIGNPTPVVSFDKWLETTVIRFVDLLQTIQNERRTAVLEALNIPNTADRKKQLELLEDFIRKHSSVKTFELSVTRAVVAKLGGLRKNLNASQTDHESLRELQDLLLPICISPSFKQSVEKHLAEGGSALISGVVTTEAGIAAELAAAPTDGRSPSFLQNDAGDVIGRGRLKFVNQAIGDPSPDAMVAEILHGLADQLSCSFKVDIQDEPDVSKRISLWTKVLKEYYDVHRLLGEPRSYCIIALPDRLVDRNKMIELVGQIRRDLPDLVFFELHHDPEAKKDEEIIMLILQSRFKNGGTR